MSKSVLAKLKQGYREQSTVKRALWSGTFNTLSTFSWYALPDYLRSRKSRSGTKILLLTGEITWGWLADVIPSLRIGFQDTENEGCAGHRDTCECHRDAESEEEDTVNTIPAPVAFTFVAVLLSLLSLVEKLIFSRGEKRRQAGRRYAHTKQAIWIAIVTGILSAITEALPDSEDELV